MTRRIANFPNTSRSLPPGRDGSVVSVSVSHAIGRGFAPRPGNTIDHHTNDTNCHPAWHAIRQGWSSAVQPDFLKRPGSVYGDVHLKYILGSIARVGYRIPVRLLSSATWPYMPKKH